MKRLGSTVAAATTLCLLLTSTAVFRPGSAAVAQANTGTRQTMVDARVPYQFNDISPNGTDPNGNGLYAGRIVDAEIDPRTYASSQFTYLAASITGGLYRSIDSGSHWTRLTSLDRYGQYAISNIAFEPSDGSQVYVIARGDGQVPTQSGVYRSTDGGLNFGPAVNPRPPCGDATTPRLAINPGDGTVYAAINCRIGIQHDPTTGFTWVNPSGGTSQYEAVTVAPDGTAFACADDGIYMRVSDSNWQRISAMGDANCEIAADPVSNNHTTVFVAVGTYSGNGGHPAIFELDAPASGMMWNATNLNGPLNYDNGHIVVVEARPHGSVADFGDGQYDVYFANTVNTWKLTCNPAAAAPHCLGAANWTEVADYTVHTDPFNYVFDPAPHSQHCVVLGTNDGGVAVPVHANCDGTASPDSGAQWKLSNSGIHALQPANMTGTQLLDGSTDLYLAMLDNGWMSHNTGSGTCSTAWCSGGGADGALVRPDVAQQISTPVRLFAWDNGGPIKAGQYMTGQSGTNFPPNFDGGVGISNQRFADYANKSYIAVSHTGSSTQAYYTTDEGATWHAFGTPIPDASSPDPAVGADIEVQVVGQPYTSTPRSYIRTDGRLFEIDGLSPSETPTLISNGLTEVGAYAIAPDGQHMYAFDCGSWKPCANGSFVASANGGISWSHDALLTRLVQTDWNGNPYPLAGTQLANLNRLDVEAQTIAFDPSDVARVVAGTNHVGTFVTEDSGSSWGRLPEVVPYVSSIVFSAQPGHFFLGTWGNGEYEVVLNQSRLQMDANCTVSGGLATVVAWLSGDSGPITGAQIHLSLYDSSNVLISGGNGTTGRTGGASAHLAIPAAGTFTLRAHYDGNSTVVGTDAEIRVNCEQVSSAPTINPHNFTHNKPPPYIVFGGDPAQPGDIVYWRNASGDTPIATKYVSQSELDAFPPSSLLNNIGAAELYVRHSDGSFTGGVVEYLTGLSTSLAGYTTASSSDLKGTALASLGQGAGNPGSLTASASGYGWFALAQFTSTPATTDAPGVAPGGYFDLHLPVGHAFTSLTVQDCNLNGNQQVLWNDGTNWQPASSQSFDKKTGCATVTIGSATSPSLDDLNGTFFGAGQVGATYVPVSHLTAARSHGQVVVRWRLASARGIAGFNLYAGHRRLNAELIRAHRSMAYRFSAPDVRSTRIRLQVLLTDGRHVSGGAATLPRR